MRTINITLFNVSLLTAAVFSANPLLSPVAFAEGSSSLALEEVIVTAQKRAQSLQDVPISVNAFSGDKIAEAGVTDLENLSSFVPNFSINQTGISTTIQIRGISSGNNQGFEQSVGMYVDGIYYGRAQLARAPLFDVERVEVLRGPQSILFGKNSIAGAVSTTTAKPTDEFSTSISFLYEPDHGETDAQFVVSGPLSDTFGARLAVQKRSLDGYIENTTLNKDEPNKEDEVIRATLEWAPTDRFNATLKLEKSTFDVKGRNMETFLDTAGETGFGLSTIYPALTGGDTLDFTQDFKRQANGDTSDNETENIVLTMEYGLGDHTLASVTGYNAYEYDELCDCEYTGANIFTLGLDEDFDQVSQEFRIVSPVGETVEYIAGVFYQKSNLFFHDDFNIPTTSPLTALSAALAGYNTQRNFDQDTDLWSVFAQTTWHLNDSVRLTLGGRYTDENKDATREQFSSTTGPNPDVIPGVPLLSLAENTLRTEPNSVAGSRGESAFTPLANIQVDVADNVMVYATYTTAFKSGGFDVRSNASPDPSVGVPAAITTALGQPPSPVGIFEFEEEEATSIELGMKMTMLDDAAELNIAAYRTNYEDLQVSIFDGGLGFNVGNAAEATVQGFELDGRWRVAENLTLSGSLGYLDFEFDDYDNGECYFLQETTDPASVTNAALGTCSFDGQRQAYTPEWTSSISADFFQPMGDSLEFRAVLDLNYSDDYIASPSLDPRVKQDAFTKVGLRLALSSIDELWEAALIGRNLTDESILTYGTEIPTTSTLVSGATGGQQGAAYYGFFDRPRSVAIQASLRF